MLWPINYVVFDLETGGLWEYNNPFIELAIVVVDSDLNKKLEYENFILPYKGKKTPTFPDGKEMKIEPQALQANGIDMKDVIEKGVDVKILYKDLVKIFKDLKCGRYQKPILVGHNIASFDINFLEYIFDLFEKRDPEKRDISPLYNYVDRFLFDTMTESRMKLGIEEMENHQLGTVCAKYGIELTDAHRAMNDTKANAELFIKMMKDKRTGSIIIGEQSERARFRDTFTFQI
jgi:DNA polymerase-3 subunit alpha (Gram-positive type)